MAACDRCGEPNSAEARFCAACGSTLAGPPPEALEVRKTVTVLFCDVVGSTELGEAADPETTRRVMARYARTMSEVVEAYGGTVERFRGDEVMAVFGVPFVHEDDALRAVRAAMEMQRRLAELNEELRETWGVELACRIGINTGEVVAGDPGTGSTFVTGDAVNLGKRLEQAANPGEILIGTDTYPLVRDAVQVGPRQRFTAKGKREAVDRFRLDDVDATAAGYARRLDAPLVDRVAELERLQETIETSLDEGRCTIVSIVGPAGIGKSRLALELTARLAERARVAFGRCLPYGSGITYWPLVEVIRDLGGLDVLATQLDDTEVERAAVASVRSAVARSETVVPNDEVFWGVRTLIERLARDRPLVLCFEDLHWAEPTMLDLVDYIAAFAHGPIVLLCNGRPELLELRPTWARYPLAELGHLSPAETGELVALLGVEDEAVRDRIAETAEGNPLFAEQLAAMIEEVGSDAGDELELPASIHALLSARLDVLDAAERRVLERASVVGKEFWWSAVADLSAETDRPHVGGLLISLVHKGLVRPVHTDVGGEHTFRFRHALIRDVAYAAMPKSVRTDLHEAFADWLEAKTERGFGGHPEIVGYHAEQAFRLRTELGLKDVRTRELAERAAGLLGAAGREAFARDDMPAAAELLGRAAALLPPGEPARLEALRGRAVALWEAGRPEEGAQALERLLGEARTAGDERMTAVAALERIVHEQQLGADVESVQAAAERVIALSAPIGDDATLALAWRRISSVRRRAGEYAAAEAAARRALEHARAAGDSREEARAVDGLCNSLLYGPTPADDALATCRQLLSTESTLTLEANVTGVVAGLEAMLGYFDEARSSYRHAASLLEELGLDLARAALTQIGVPLELLAGDPEAAHGEAMRGAAIFARFGSAAVQAPLIAEALHAQGRYGEAAEAIADASAESGPEIAQWQVRLRIMRALLAIVDDRPADAARSASEGVRLADQTEDLSLRGDAAAALAETLRFAGPDDRADAAMNAAAAFYRAKGNVAALARLKARANV
ncbi:MAG TPA: adenylate/guanylate cyclase domain-containing protein [Gaiella sp.]|nr:adenylate/guanylate cyclase domain-containing protein [Gaiella sp.]